MLAPLRSLRALIRADLPAAAVQAGLRAGTATVVPIALAWATGRPVLVWAALGGWLTSIADAGGAYRARARAMLAYVVGGAATVAIASTVAPHHAVAIVLVTLWAVGGGLLRAAGDSGATLGTLLAATFVAALGLPAPDGRTALVFAALLAAGGGWAMLLALLVWPVRPYAPARRATADLVALLAGYVGSVTAAYRAVATVGSAPADTRTTGEHEAHFATMARTEHARLRVALEHARRVIGDTRRTRLGTSRRAEDVVVLVEQADDLFGTLVAVADAVEAVALAGPGSAAADPRARRAVLEVLTQLGVALTQLAAALPSGRRAGERPAALPALDAAVFALWEAVEPAVATAVRAGLLPPTHVPGTRLRHAAALLEHAATLVEAMADTNAALVRGAESAEARPGAVTRVRDGVGDAWRGLLGRGAGWLRAVTAPDSVVLRHALRLGVTVAAAQLLAGALHVTRGTWLTTTALLVLQPHVGLTWQRGKARVLGTVLGGVVAALLALVLRDRLVVAAVMFPLSVAAIAVRSLGYGLFTFFLTPVFVLLAEPALGDWRLAGVRIVDTLLGGALAVVASRVLWPTFEWQSLPTTIAGMLDAVAEYARLVTADRPPAPEALSRARRRVGLAGNAADAALERFLAEPRGPWRDAEAIMAVLARARRVNGASTALATLAGPRDPSRVAALDALLRDLADAVRAQRPPAPLDPALLAVAVHASRGTAEHQVVDPLAGPLVRLTRQAVGLHGAVSRLLGASPEM